MLSIDALCSLYDVKAFLNIPQSTTEKDTLLEFCVNGASGHIRRYCKHSLRRKTFTEDYDGVEGQTELVLRQFPVVSVTSLYDDTDRAYTSDTLIDPEDYGINYDAGMIVLDGETFCTGVRNIRAVYVAGYAEFTITAGYNDAIDFEETDGEEITAYLTPGDYTQDTLATELETQLNYTGASTYTVSFDSSTQKYTITSDLSGGAGVFNILWSTGTHVAVSCAAVLGYDATANDEDAATYTSDNVAGMIPESLRMACAMLAARLYRASGSGLSDLGVISEALPQGQGTMVYEKDMPKFVKDMLQPYRDVHVL